MHCCSLEQLEPNSMRLLIEKGCGFVYDPVVLENPRATYLVDWGDVHRNEEIARCIASLTANDSALHTFIFSSKNVRISREANSVTSKLMPCALDRMDGFISATASGT